MMTSNASFGPCDRCGKQAAESDEVLCPSCKAQGSGEGEKVKRMTDAQIEREQVEAVFSLGGGELDDKPTAYTFVDDDTKEVKEASFLYPYDGPPEYATSDFPVDGPATYDQFEYFTVVQQCLWGLPPETITVKGKVYTQAGHFVSSGETECPAKDCEEDPFAGEVCPLCERMPATTGVAGEEHGCIYLGDGWAEVVYRHDRAEHLRGIARRTNLQIFESGSLECQGCGVVVCGGIELIHEKGCEFSTMDTRQVIEGPKGFWWQSQSPGCLPDSEPLGPFDTEFEALEDATEGLDD